MMQELTSDQQPSSFQVPQISKDKKRSLVQDVTKQLEECYITNRRSPKMVVAHTSVPGGKRAKQDAVRDDISWLFLRSNPDDNCRVPNWAGFVSVTGTVPRRLTTIDYYPVIYILLQNTPQFRSV